MSGDKLGQGQKLLSLDLACYGTFTEARVHDCSLGIVWITWKGSGPGGKDRDCPLMRGHEDWIL
jgi:hypothetical protein